MFDVREREKIRRGLNILVEEAPLAPDFETLAATQLRPLSGEARSSLPAFTTAAFLVIVAGGLALFLAPGRSGPEPGAPKESVPPVSEPLPLLAPGEFPKLVVDMPDWTVSYVYDSEGETVEDHMAEILFTDASGAWQGSLRLTTGPSVDFEMLAADRLASGTRLADQTVLGSEAVVVRFDNSNKPPDPTTAASDFGAIWSDNGVVYEFVAYDLGELGEERLRSLLNALARVNEDEWVARLPDAIVTDRAAAVQEYLADIPLPPGFDPIPLEEGPVEHWYQVGADTVGAVACGWLDHWVNAKATGDEGAMQQAVEAMAGSRQWDVLVEMSTEGGFHEMVYEYADAIAAEGTLAPGYEPQPGEPRIPVEESYAQAFRCNTG